MFDRLVNTVRIDLSITPRGPLLIRSGRTGADPSRPDLEWVRTTLDGRPTVYVPGSSLKGVMRAHAERLLRGEGVRITGTFDGVKAFDQRSSGGEVWKGTSPLGRTFGTLHLRSAFSVSDLLPGGREASGSEARAAEVEEANLTERRNGVAIDRLLGSAKGGALFDQEVVVGGRFDGRLVMRNPQLYQLALVLIVLRDMDEGFVQLGSGSSRGNGWVAATVHEVVAEQRPGTGKEGHLQGRKLLDAATEDLFGGDEVVLPAGLKHQTSKRGLWQRTTFPAASVDGLLQALVDGPPWSQFLSGAKGGRSWVA